MNVNQLLVRRMMQIFEQATPDYPEIPSNEVLGLRANLIQEELNEFMEAAGVLQDPFADKSEAKEPDMVGMIDGLADILVVTYGTAVALGVDIEPFFMEVMRANFSKLGDDGLPIKREDGKFLKGPNYNPPDIRGVMSAEHTNHTPQSAYSLNALAREQDQIRFWFEPDVYEKVFPQALGGIHKKNNVVAEAASRDEIHARVRGMKEIG